MIELKAASLFEFEKVLSGRSNKLFYSKKEADNVIAELEERIAELERMDTEHTLQIAKMNGYISRLEEERRWRKFSEEKPKEKQWILVFVENPSKYGTYIELRRWDMGCKFDVENQELYTKFMPLPSAPEEYKQ